MGLKHPGRPQDCRCSQGLRFREIIC
uniref:Uncharacterized protein n=1 Tax=Arundo donax TaxID=35708 RepID=A0A0A9GUZ6_ARUDO